MSGTAGPVLILGAASDIGRAVARAYGQDGRALILAARRARRLEADATDLRLRFGVKVSVAEFDALNEAGLVPFVDGLGELPQTAVCAVGLLGDQSRAEHDAPLAARVMRTNYLGPALILGELANRMATRGSGTIVGVSSVAGERGRASNYLYGSAKAGFTAFLSGLRNRLAHAGVRVVTVKPGFVATRMTAHRALPSAFTAQPKEVAAAILRAERKGSDVVYVRAVWRLIMLAIRVLPEAVFKRTAL